MGSKLLILVIGGSLGTLCRYYMSEWGHARFGTAFPFGTLIVNVSGCLIMGLLLGILESRYPNVTEAPYQIRLLLMTGFLGAMTTFSSYELEALLLFRQGAWERALLYIVGSVVLGLLVMAGAFQAVRLIARA